MKALWFARPAIQSGGRDAGCYVDAGVFCECGVEDGVLISLMI